jgi:hypothetical protein
MDLKLCERTFADALTRHGRVTSAFGSTADMTSLASSSPPTRLTLAV